MAKLGDIAELITKGTTPTSVGYEFLDSGVNFVKIETIADNGKFINSKLGFISQECNQCLKRSQLKENDILFSIAGAIGRIAIVTKDILPANTNQALAIIRIPSTIVSHKYVAYALQASSITAQANKKKQGVAQLNISLKDVSEFEIPLPDLATQRQIAATLDKVTEGIAICKQMLSDLDTLVKSRFVEMFGDPKKNEKGWKTGVVSDYYKVKGGKRIPKGMGYSNCITEHPYLRASDMKNETIIDDDIHYIDDEVFQHIKNYTVKGGDIYLTNVGVNLGMAGVIPEKYNGANITENAVKLVPMSEGIIDGLFLSYYINSPGIQEYIDERKMAVGVPKLAIFRIETMPLIIPPIEVQTAFNEFCKQLDTSKVVIQQQLSELEALKGSLIQKYFE